MEKLALTKGTLIYSGFVSLLKLVFIFLTLRKNWFCFVSAILASQVKISKLSMSNLNSACLVYLCSYGCACNYMFNPVCPSGKV